MIHPIGADPERISSAGAVTGHAPSRETTAGDRSAGRPARAAGRATVRWRTGSDLMADQPGPCPYQETT
ncbi:hypothetical protein KCH_73170 [Kitasatospora cheerisanensis KCTC 2395]|uniref:Uncharacterized protein n=1 Tax=Kitasatospora cheerisanensis KCTC 2395 TaxID=1348663 RepID=A0A066YLZ9_9ACTN|nr:hypothetical protein KCH_73170 [Kitasatospora cheerisanensis KCTC 2395]